MTTVRNVGSIVFCIALVIVGLYVTYAFGAGYFPAIALPNPWNLLASAGLMALLLWLAFRCIAKSMRKDT